MIRRIPSYMPLLWLAVLAMPWSSLQAQQQSKAVAVLSISSIDDLMSDIGYLTESAGSGELGQMVTLMSGAYLEGIDRDNPIGMVLNTDGQEFTPMGFVPVKDLDKVLSVLEDSVGTPEDAGDGIKEIPGFQPIFVKEQGGYAFVGQTIESMRNLPANPVASLGDLPQEYDLAIRGFAQNVPEEYLKMAVQGLQEGVRQGLEALPDEDKERQERLLELQLKQMETYITESDQLTIGWKTEPEKGRTFIDIAFSAVADSELARQMNALSNATSDYSGFILPGAAVAMNFTGEIPEEQLQAGIDAIEDMKAAAIKELSRDVDLEDKEAATELLEAAIEILTETMKTGKLDGAASLMLESGNPQLLAGFHVADGKEVEEMLRRMAELAAEEPGFPGINFDAATANGVTYHTMVVDVPADEQEARKALGDRLEMAVGIGKSSAYMGVGRDCVNALKQVVGKQAKAQKVTPFEMTVALTPIMEFANEMEENTVVSSIMEALNQSDKDHVRLSVQPIKDGFRYRIELEEGVLQAIGAGVRMSNEF